MKRSVTLLNEDSKGKESKKESKEIIKSVYYSSDIDESRAPYYDPYDIHIHKWVVGRMDNPQNHHEPMVQVNNRYSFDRDVSYCSICHEINYEKPFPLKNRVNVLGENILSEEMKENEENDYSKEKRELNKISKEFQFKNGYKKNEIINEPKVLNSKLFMNSNEEESSNDEWIKLV